MKNKILLALAVTASALFLAGCATQQTRSGKATSVAQGLAYVNTASYLPPAATGIDNYGLKYDVNGTPSGKQVSVLWGLFTYTDY